MSKQVLVALLCVSGLATTGCASTAAVAESEEDETGYGSFVTVSKPAKCPPLLASKRFREVVAVGVLAAGGNTALATESAVKWWVLD